MRRKMKQNNNKANKIQHLDLYEFILTFWSDGKPLFNAITNT